MLHYFIYEKKKDRAGRENTNDTNGLWLKGIREPDDMDLSETKDGEIPQVSRRLSSGPQCAAGKYITGAPSIYQGQVDSKPEATSCTKDSYTFGFGWLLASIQQLADLNVDCSTGSKAIGSWNVKYKSSKCESAKPINIGYQCLSISNFVSGVERIETNTGWKTVLVSFDFGTLRNDLNNHYVSCPDDSILQQFEVDGGTSNQAKIDYKCAKVGTTLCQTHYASNQFFYFPHHPYWLNDLTKFPISCPTNKPFMQSWTYDIDNVRFQFKCCSIAVCYNCKIGTFSANQGDNQCTPCPAGKYNNLTGQTNCKTCQSGEFSHAGASSCMKCQVGHYQNIIGQSSCKECNAGTYTDGIGQADCKTCPSGMYSNKAASKCIFCPGGTYSGTAAAGLAGCNKCEAGTYSTDVDPNADDSQANKFCSPCSNGKWSPKGSKKCFECPDGTTVNNDQSGCDDIDECKDDSKHGCPEDSFCKNIVKNEASDGADFGYKCHCNPGFAVKGSEGKEVSGNDEIICEARPIQLQITSSSYKTIDGLKIAHSTIESDAGFVGCYDVTGDDDWQAVARTAGETCVDVCSDYKYAAESSSSVCFCSNSFPETIQEAISSNECDKASV